MFCKQPGRRKCVWTHCWASNMFADHVGAEFVLWLPLPFPRYNDRLMIIGRVCMKFGHYEHVRINKADRWINRCPCRTMAVWRPILHNMRYHSPYIYPEREICGIENRLTLLEASWAVAAWSAWPKLIDVLFTTPCLWAWKMNIYRTNTRTKWFKLLQRVENYLAMTPDNNHVGWTPVV